MATSLDCLWFRPPPFLRAPVYCWATLVLACGFIVPGASARALDLEHPVKFHIVSQPIGLALIEFSSQAHIQVIIAPDADNSFVAPALNDAIPPRIALELLLRNSGLKYFAVGETIRVSRDHGGGAFDVGGYTDNLRPFGKESTDIRVRHSPERAASAAATLGETSQGERVTELQEVVVSAEKRSEKLIDVPVSITSISGNRLESLQVRSLSDLTGYVPSLSVNSSGAPGFQSSLALRGITNIGGNGPLVGTYIDNVPLGASTTTARGIQIDLMPYDIERIEVLEGPQGTLYGSNTMGGLIKYTLRAPDLVRFDARAGTDIQSVKGSHSLDWGVHGAINVPIINNTLALRVSAFDQTTAGWINNIGTNTRDSNHMEQVGGRGVLLWQPIENLSVKAAFIYEDIKPDDTSIVMIDTANLQPIYGKNVKNTSFLEPVRTQTRNSSLDINWDLNFATLTSTTDFSRVKQNVNEDYPGLGFLCIPRPPSEGDPGWPGCPNYPYGDALGLYEIDDELSKFVQEVRLTSSEKGRFQWMIGGYFTREYGGETAQFPFFTPSKQPVGTDLLNQTGNNESYKEKAGFGNATYKLSDYIEISAGARHSIYDQVKCPGIDTGQFGAGVAGPCDVLPSRGVSTWMGNLRVHLNQDTMLYARVATANRPGFSQTGSPVVEAPLFVKPDKTTNYELGFKGNLLEHRLQLTATAFDIEWKDIQILSFSTAQNTLGFGYESNGGTARSAGLELSALWQVIERLRINAALDYTDSHLTNDVPGPKPPTGAKGDQLPYSPRFGSSITLDYSQSLNGNNAFIAGGAYRYRDATVNRLAAKGTSNIPMPPQNLVDVYAGMEVRQLSLRLYLQNVFNNHSYAGTEFNADPSAYKWVPVQPRTIGFSADVAL